MTLNPWVPVSIACSGRTRTLPLLSLAAALRVDTQRLEIPLRVFLGLGEFAEFSGEFSQPERSEPNVSVPSEPNVTFDSVPSERSERSERTSLYPSTLGSSGAPFKGAPDEHPNDQNERSETLRENDETTLDEAAKVLALALDDLPNIAAIRVLVRAHPPERLEEALKRTIAIASTDVRRSRGAIFTGITKRLAAIGWRSDSRSPAPYAPPPTAP